MKVHLWLGKQKHKVLATAPPKPTGGAGAKPNTQVESLPPHLFYLLTRGPAQALPQEAPRELQSLSLSPGSKGKLSVNVISCPFIFHEIPRGHSSHEEVGHKKRD